MEISKRDRFWQRRRWRRKLASDYRKKKKRMPLASRKVDRWRFFTHLARRASICIKLIGSPYWLLLFKREGKRERREREREKGRNGGKKVMQEGVPSLTTTPFFDNAGRE